jgi:hypothetical protein
VNQNNKSKSDQAFTIRFGKSKLLGIFLTCSIIAPLIGITPALAATNNRSVEFKIVSVTTTGPVVRVRFEVPSSCWTWTFNRATNRDTTIVLSITGVYNGSKKSYCPSKSFISTSIFELSNSATKITDSSGKVWWSRPGVEDFKLITSKAGSQAIKASVLYNSKPAPISYDYTLSCKNGYRASIMKQKPTDTAFFSNLKKGTLCTVSMRAVFLDSSIVLIESKPLLI